jgi:hypothetical protein
MAFIRGHPQAANESDRGHLHKQLSFYRVPKHADGSRTIKWIGFGNPTLCIENGGTKDIHGSDLQGY